MTNNLRTKYVDLVRSNLRSRAIKTWRTRHSILINEVEELNKRKKIKVLELGSGRGFLVKELADKGVDIVGSDFNPVNIELARKINKVELLEADATNLDLPPDSFDVVISCELVEHLPDILIHLGQVKKVLKPGGYYFITTPNSIIEFLYNLIRKKRDELHISTQSHVSLNRALRNTGFDNVKFLKMTNLTVSQIDKLGFLHRFYPIKLIPLKLQPTIICKARLKT